MLPTQAVLFGCWFKSPPPQRKLIDIPERIGRLKHHQKKVDLVINWLWLLHHHHQCHGTNYGKIIPSWNNFFLLNPLPKSFPLPHPNLHHLLFQRNQPSTVINLLQQSYKINSQLNKNFTGRLLLNKIQDIRAKPNNSNHKQFKSIHNWLDMNEYLLYYRLEANYNDTLECAWCALENLSLGLFIQYPPAYRPTLKGAWFRSILIWVE